LFPDDVLITAISEWWLSTNPLILHVINWSTYQDFQIEIFLLTVCVLFLFNRPIDGVKSW